MCTFLPIGVNALTDNVNLMARSLTNQVQSIAKRKAAASGDLTKKIKVHVRGKVLELKEMMNRMAESLSVFSDEVMWVMQEVGASECLKLNDTVT